VVTNLVIKSSEIMDRLVRIQAKQDISYDDTISEHENAEAGQVDEKQLRNTLRRRQQKELDRVQYENLVKELSHRRRQINTYLASHYLDKRFVNKNPKKKKHSHRKKKLHRDFSFEKKLHRDFSFRTACMRTLERSGTVSPRNSPNHLDRFDAAPYAYSYSAWQQTERKSPLPSFRPPPNKSRRGTEPREGGGVREVMEEMDTTMPSRQMSFNKAEVRNLRKLREALPKGEPFMTEFEAFWAEHLRLVLDMFICYQRFYHFFLHTQVSRQRFDDIFLHRNFLPPYYISLFGFLEIRSPIQFSSGYSCLWGVCCSILATRTARGDLESKTCPLQF
jgi:hypothetical protein